MENFIFCAVLAIGMIDVHESVKVRYYGSTSLGGVELVKVQMFIPNSDGLDSRFLHVVHEAFRTGADRS